MRMWMVEPELLCRKHLLGEHGEIHKHRHNFVKRHNMEGRKGQIFPTLMQMRHDELAIEMAKRGYNHNSPYQQPDVTYLEVFPLPNIEANKEDLCTRCTECKQRIYQKQIETGGE